MTIPIKGIIGYDVRGVEFAERIARLNGDIDFEIDSPGGSVFDGISIFNAIKNYNKGKCNIKVVGDCSSMAAYIMLAGDTLRFESNAVVVLHNPWNLTIGDYRAMQDSATVLEKLAAMYASKFVEKGIFTEKEIRTIMDAETWFVGAKDLRQLGEVIGDENEDEETENDKELKIAACREKMNECMAKIREINECSLDKIAALITTPTAATVQTQSNTPYTATGIKSSKTENKGAAKMNIEELKTQHAALFNEVLAMGEKQGVEKERARMNAFMGFMDVDKDATIKALKDGKDINDNEFQASILMARVKADTIKGMQDDNPPAVDPQIETHAPEKDGEGDDNAAKEAAAKAAKEKEDKSFAKIMGYCGYNV